MVVLRSQYMMLCKNESTEIFESKSQRGGNSTMWMDSCVRTNLQKFLKANHNHRLRCRQRDRCCVRTNLQKFLKANHNIFIQIMPKKTLCKNESTEIFESKSQQYHQPWQDRCRCVRTNLQKFLKANHNSYRVYLSVESVV